jgi:hypothetical protein
VSEKPEEELFRLTGGASIPTMQPFTRKTMDGAPIPKMQSLSEQLSAVPVVEESPRSANHIITDY